MPRSRGAASAGASRILVNDSHWLMRNLLAEELHEAAELISSGPKRLSMMEGVDGGFDAVLCIGYHAMAGTRHATIDHTYTDRIHRVKLNGRPVGELGLNAAVAGCFRGAGRDGVGRPGTGRRGARAARRWRGDGGGKGGGGAVLARAACHRPKSCRRIRAGATRALQRKHAPFTLASPVTLEVEFALTQHADNAELVPGSERRDGRTLTYTHADYREVFRAFRAMYNLASVPLTCPLLRRLPVERREGAAKVLQLGHVVDDDVRLVRVEAR